MTDTLKSSQKLLKTLLACTLCLLAAHTVKAQEQQQRVVRRELVHPEIDFFVPHWQLGLQAGGAYDIGEDKATKLLSPALQLTAAYQFDKYVSARMGLSGLWARNRYAYPEARYKWNFIQPAADLKVDLASLLLGWVYDQPVSTYAFVGLGVAYAFNNDEAVQANERFGIEFQKLWEGHRWNPVVRAGVGADVRLTDQLALTVEGNANMLPDHFNSKRGRADNRDWHFNALVGLKLNLSRSHGALEARFRDIKEPVPVVVAPKPKPRKEFQPGDTIALTEYVRFQINTSNIRESQIPKIERVLNYLQHHPEARVELTGFADKDTGTPTINDRLSRERATNVTEWLVEHGIERHRIGKYAKGDRVQPFRFPEDNRVTICIVIDNTIVQIK